MILKFETSAKDALKGFAKKITLMVFFFLSSLSLVKATDHYWVGGTGNWSDVNHWSLSSGNSGGLLAPSVPQQGDNIIFDANSGFTAGNIIVYVNQVSECANLTVANSATGVYIYASATLSIYGNVNLQTGTFLGGNFTFAGAGNNTLNFNGGVGTQSIYETVNLKFKSTGTWNIQGQFNGSPNSSILFHQGTLNFGSSIINTGYFDQVSSDVVEPRTLNLNSAVINLSGRNNYPNPYNYSSWTYIGTDLNAGTSVINIQKGADDGYAVYFNGKDGQIYNEVNFTNPNAPTSSYGTYGILNGSLTFNKLKFASNGTISTACTIGVLDLAKSKTYTINANQTISTITNLTGDCDGMWTLQSASSPTQRTITSSNPIILNRVRLKYIKVVGTGPFTANNSIDLGNNVGWTFSSTPKSLYWIGGGGNWSDALHWTTNADGTPIAGGCVPTRNDNVFFNSFSGTISAANPVIVDKPDAECKNITWSGVSGAPVLKTTSPSNMLNIYGSSQWQNGMLYQVGTTNYLAATTGNTITSNATIFEGMVVFNGAGEYILADDFSNPTSAVNFNNGTLNFNGKNVLLYDFYGNNVIGARTLNLGSSVITVKNEWNYSYYYATPAINLNAGTSQFNMTKVGGRFLVKTGHTYYNLTFTSSTGTALLYEATLGGAAAVTFNNITFNGAGVLNGSSNATPITIGTLNLAASQKYTFSDKSLFTITNIISTTPECAPFTEILSATTGTKFKLKLMAPNTVTNVRVQDIDASPGVTLVVLGGVNSGNTTNVTLTPSPSKNFYWIGGTGNWNDPAHWTLNSDGTANNLMGCLPSVVDNVFFNQYSGTNYTVTVNVPANCKNMTWEEVAGSKPTLNGLYANPLNIWGSLVLQTGMVFNVEYLKFQSTASGNTITTHNVVSGYSSANSSAKGVFFNGIGGVWTLMDTFNVKNFGVTNGELITNNQTINAENYYAENSSTVVNPTLTLGSSVINVTGYFEGSMLKTVNKGTSTINMLATLDVTSGSGTTTGTFQSNGPQTWNDINFFKPTVAGKTSTIYSNLTPSYNNVTFYGDAKITGNNTYNILTFAPNSTVNLTVYNGVITQTVNQLVNNTNCGYWYMTTGSTTGSRAVIKGLNNITLNNVVLTSISATGGKVYTANGINVANNAGWTFGNITGKNLYWIGGNGDWNDPSHWTTNADGTPSGGCTPTRYDNVFFNQYSGTSPKVNMAVSGLVECHDITFSGVPGSPNMSFYTLNVYGSLALQAGQTFSTQVTFMSSETGKTILTSGVQIDNNMFFYGTGSYTLLDDLNLGLSAINFNSGSINTNGKKLTLRTFAESTGTAAANRSLVLGNSTIEIQTMGSWIYTGNNLDAGTSTINIKGNAPQFTGKDGAVYYDLFMNGDPNSTNTIFSGNTFHNLTFAPRNSTYILPAGKTTNVTNQFLMSGTNCYTTMVQSSVAGTQANIKVDGGSTTYNFTSIRDVNASNLAFTILPQSTNRGNNTNITFQPSTGAGIGALGADRVICTTDLPLTLSASAFIPNANTTLQWKNVTTNTNLGTSLTQVITAAGRYSVTVDYGENCIVTDEILITANSAAPQSDIIAPNVINCSGVQATVLNATLKSGSAVTNPVFTWYDDANRTTVLGTGTSITVNPTASRNYYVTLKGDNACESAVKTVAVTYGTPPTTANAGPDQKKSGGYPLPFTMAANNPSVGTGKWVVISGDVLINDVNAYSTVINLKSGNSAELQWQISNGACVSADNVIITREMTGVLVNPNLRFRVSTATSKPDLTINSVAKAGNMLPAEDTDWGIKINNITAVPTAGAIVVKIAAETGRANSATLKFNANATQITVNGVAYTVSNQNWDVVYDSVNDIYTFTSKPGFIIQGNSSVYLGLQVIKNSSNTNFSDAVLNISVTGGSEAPNDAQNHTVQVFQYDSNANYQ